MLRTARMFCNRKIAPASMRVYVSAALYGNEIAMLTLLSELERHVQPNLTVVHISKGIPTLSAANLRQWELAPERTLFNPDRRHVHRGRPSVLVAHLSNLFMLARRRPAIADEDKVVLVAGNQRFFRSCREHLLSTTLSFMIGQLVDLRCGSDCDKPSHVFAKPTTYPSSEFARHVRKIRQERDTFLDIHPYHKGFVRVMRNMVNGTSRVDNVTSWLPRIWSDDTDAASVAFPRAKPLTFMPHEGTFYPFGLLRAFFARGWSQRDAPVWSRRQLEQQRNAASKVRVARPWLTSAVWSRIGGGGALAHLHLAAPPSEPAAAQRDAGTADGGACVAGAEGKAASQHDSGARPASAVVEDAQLLHLRHQAATLPAQQPGLVA